MRRYLGAALVILAAACAKKAGPPTVQTALVGRRDVIVDAQANGIIEPLAIVDVKSKAGGVITKMTVETGTHVSPGDLIVQIDTRDVQNNYDQAAASLTAAETKLSVSESDKKRNEEMYKARVITAQEFEKIAVDYETSKSGVVNAKANLDLKKQALEDATVRAPSNGTIITKNVSVGTVIASANGSVSGGTTIVQMADLGVVRIRALFNETDIGNIRPGEPANVTVDAYPDRRFAGVVEKIEPQAVVQQNVTMFPVLVNLQNQENLLKPGMNGQVSVLIDERDQVIAIPNDAIKNPREAVATGAMLGLNADTVNKELAAQGYSGGSRGGFNRGAGGAGAGGAGAGGRRNGGAAGGATPPSGGSGSANGEVALMDASMPVVQQGQQGGGAGGFGQQVTDEDCKAIDAVLKKHPKEKKQLDDLRAKMAALRPAGGAFAGGRRGGDSTGGANRPRGGDSTQRRRGGGNGGNPGGNAGGGATPGGAAGGQQGTGGRGGGSPDMQAMRALYEQLGIDARKAGGCARRAQGAGNAGQTGAGQTGGTTRGARTAGGQGNLTPPPEGAARPVRTRQGLVFVSDSAKTSFHPRIVQLGQANLDYTEVLNGLKEGERVVMLGALALQAQRQQQQDRLRQNASPLGGGATPPGPGPGGGAPGGGGGGRGGRGG